MTTDVYLSYDIDQKEVMYSKNSDKEIAPASITKLMTAILFLENFEINDKIEIRIIDNEIKGKVAYLTHGEVMTISTLLDFLLVYSANDAAHAVALAVSDTESDFINLMNIKAKELGMNNTNFVNVHGLDDLAHFTTLNDLLLLALAAISYDEIIVSTSKEYFSTSINNNEQVKYKSTNTLISENFTGLKTGWTTNAGLTFMGLYQDVDRNIITIVSQSKVDLKKINHFSDSVLLKNTSITNFKEINVLEQGAIIANVYSGTGVKSVKNNSSITVFGDIKTKHEFTSINVDYNLISFDYDNKVLNFSIPPLPKISMFNKLIFWLFN